MTYQDQLPGLFKQIPYVRNFRDLRLDFRDTIVSDFQIKNLLLFTKAVTIFKLLHLKVSNFVFEQEISNEKYLYKISKVQNWSEIMFFFCVEYLTQIANFASFDDFVVLSWGGLKIF